MSGLWISFKREARKKRVNNYGFERKMTQLPSRDEIKTAIKEDMIEKMKVLGFELMPSESQYPDDYWFFHKSGELVVFYSAVYAAVYIYSEKEKINLL